MCSVPLIRDFLVRPLRPQYIPSYLTSLFPSTYLIFLIHFFTGPRSCHSHFCLYTFTWIPLCLFRWQASSKTQDESLLHLGHQDQLIFTDLPSSPHPEHPESTSHSSKFLFSTFPCHLQNELTGL